MSKSKFTKSQIKELIEVYQVEVKKLAYQTQNVRATIAKLKADMKKAPAAAKPAKKVTKKKVAKKVAKKKTTKKVAKKKPAKKVTRKVAKKVAKKKTAAKKGKVTRKVAKRVVVKRVTEKAPVRKTKAKKVTKKVTKKAPVRKAKKVTKKVAKSSDGRKGNAGRKAVVTPWDNFVLSSIKSAKKGMVSADLFKAVKVKAQKAKEYKNDAVTKTLINRSLQKLVNKQKELAKYKHAGRGFAYGLPSWGSKGRLKPAYKA